MLPLCTLRGKRPDDGFTLVEAVIALMVLALVASALTASVVAGVRASLVSRQNQRAADFMTRALEEARQKDFSALGHVQGDLAGDPRVSSCGTRLCIDTG